MSIFQTHARFDEGGSFSVAPMGVYDCTLTDVEVITGPKYDNPSVTEERFLWKFTATATDEDGQPYRFVKYTGTSYGNDKAALTILLDSMSGRRLRADEFAKLDVEKLKAVPWRVAVDEAKNGAGKDINKITAVRPVRGNEPPKPPRRPAPPADNSDIGDPFAE